MGKPDILTIREHAFLGWLAQHWPLWNAPGNINSSRYLDLRAAFHAGWDQRTEAARAAVLARIKANA